ncbi:putative manganese transporter [Roseospira visakhapatnamensis]|uniref:10TM heavy-metal exporter n=1 Tax=Roseospira visakhapatnamensis TaxID=390880 RepID=A0A7W6W8C3_9PROT|nr:putative manganese transporter [Roseospira visakhapatnamensis]MBB4264648.1 hypothetical protein [Roseospira visakhapatnamensis]
MSALIASLPFRSGGLPRPGRLPPVSGPVRRALALAALVGAALSVPGGAAILHESLADAYLAVSVYVAGTLLLLLLLERRLGLDLSALLHRHQRWQVPIAALLGAFPGCGGAIVALTQYTRGHLSMGGVVATLTATMGDAMFLLLAQAPATAGLIVAVSVVVGILTGLAVDRLHGPDFMRPRAAPDAAMAGPACPGGCPSANADHAEGRLAAGLRRLWLLVLGPGLVLGAMLSFQVDPDAWIAPVLGVAPGAALGVAGAVLSLALWVLVGRGGEVGAESPRGRLDLRPVVATTCFVTGWVVFAFVGFEVVVQALALDLAHWFAVAAPLVPAIGVAIGLIPGCGPQILVTSLYLADIAPLSAQLGNALSNDGDALFPAIAVAPKAAFVATLYSAVPALGAAYATYALVG